MDKISGVYKITNKITGDCYIGSSRNIKRRWWNHKTKSRWKDRPNMKLYQAFQRYGLENFEFEIIEETTDIKNREQYYIYTLKPIYNNNYAKGINIDKYGPHQKAYIWYNRMCLYENEYLTLNALSQRFIKLGIEHPTIEAMKYLVSNTTN